MDGRGTSTVLIRPSEIGERRLAWDSTKLCHVTDSYTGGEPCTEVLYPAD